MSFAPFNVRVQVRATGRSATIHVSVKVKVNNKTTNLYTPGTPVSLMIHSDDPFAMSTVFCLRSGVRVTVTLKTVPMFGYAEEIDQQCSQIKLEN